MFLINGLPVYLSDKADDGGDPGPGPEDLGKFDDKADRGDDLPKADDSFLDEDAKKEVDDELKDDKTDDATKKVADDDTKDDKKDDKKSEKDPEDDKDRRIRIPKHRFDEAIARERAKSEALAKELAEARKTSAAATPDKEIEALDKKLDDLDEKYEKAVFDGKPEQAAQFRAQRRALERERTRKEADILATQRAAAARDIAVDQVKYDTLLTRYEDEYPQLNPDAEEYDEGLMQEVAFLKDSFVRSGLGSATALQRAVRYVLGPKKAAAGKEDLDRMDEAEKRRKDREEAARKKAAAATNRQPPRTDKTGDDSDKFGGDPLRGRSIFDMSQEEFSKLSEEALAKMRGDVFAG